MSDVLQRGPLRHAMSGDAKRAARERSEQINAEATQAAVDSGADDKNLLAFNVGWLQAEVRALCEEIEALSEKLEGGRA